MVKSRRVCSGPMTKMPFADHGCLPAMTLKLTRKVPQRVVEWCVQSRHAIDVVVGAGQDRSAARSTNRIGAKGCVETHALVGDPVNVGRLVNAAAVCRDGVSGMVIAHDEHEIRRCCRNHGHHHSLPQSAIFALCPTMAT